MDRYNTPEDNASQLWCWQNTRAQSCLSLSLSTRETSISRACKDKHNHVFLVLLNLKCGMIHVSMQLQYIHVRKLFYKSKFYKSKFVSLSHSIHVACMLAWAFTASGLSSLAISAQHCGLLCQEPRVWSPAAAAQHCYIHHVHTIGWFTWVKSSHKAIQGLYIALEDRPTSHQWGVSLQQLSFCWASHQTLK